MSVSILNKNPRVSVIIPTYKRETKYLLRAIDSIKKQTYKNVEIVIVDDNPPDSEFRKRTNEFMQQYKDDPDIIYYENPQNVGGALARNNGIKLATGEYITFLDDDDEYLPEKIEKQLNFMIKHDCDMSFTNLMLVNENKAIVDYREYRNLKNFDKESLFKYHIMRHLTGTPTFMYKAAKLKDIGGFDDVKMGQEFFLMLKSIESDLKIRYLNQCYVIAYRHKNGGISQGKNKILGENNLYKFKKQYFSIFTFRERMFIRFRHYAVLAIAYKRNKEFLKAFGNTILMLLSSPLDFIKEVSYFVFKIFSKRNSGW